jgi:hypothetical protein
MTRRGTLVAAIGFVVFLGAASGANKSLWNSSTERRVFAAEYKNEGVVVLSTAGIADKTLVIETNPPDVAQCTKTLDVVAADSPFIQNVSTRLQQNFLHRLRCKLPYRFQRNARHRAVRCARTFQAQRYAKECACIVSFKWSSAPLPCGRFRISS